MKTLLRLTACGLVLVLSLVACTQDNDNDDDRDNGSEDGARPAIVRLA